MVVELRNVDSTAAETGSFYVRFNPGWSPREAIVDAGMSRIPLQKDKDPDRVLRPFEKLGYSGTKLKRDSVSRTLKWCPQKYSLSDRSHLVQLGMK